MKDKKVVFMGTPEFSIPVLKKLIENTNVVLVVTQPDAFVGRKKILTPSPIKVLAEENNIEVFTPVKIREDYQKIIDINPDIIVTCAYGQIIPKVILDLPKYKCVNVHASLLPKYRGGAPIHAALLNGDDETGITIMYMDEGMDSGDIITNESIKILDNDNINTLSLKLSELGANLLIKTLPDIFNNKVKSIKQDESKVTFAYIIKRKDELIDFNKTYKEIYNKVRALYNRAYFILNNTEYKVISIRCENKLGEISKINNIYKDGIGIGSLDKEVVITEFIPSGKNKMLVKSFLNGVDKNKLIGAKINEEL